MKGESGRKSAFNTSTLNAWCIQVQPSMPQEPALWFQPRNDGVIGGHGDWPPRQDHGHRVAAAGTEGLLVGMDAAALMDGPFAQTLRSLFVDSFRMAN